MGPDASGFYEYYYEYDLFEFQLGELKLHGRAYADEPAEAHLLALEVNENRAFLTAADLLGTLCRAAGQYFRDAGKTDLHWLDPENKNRGYSPIPQAAPDLTTGP
jgi:hypothetical protein